MITPSGLVLLTNHFTTYYTNIFSELVGAVNFTSVAPENEVSPVEAFFQYDDTVFGTG